MQPANCSLEAIGAAWRPQVRVLILGEAQAAAGPRARCACSSRRLPPVASCPGGSLPPLRVPAASVPGSCRLALRGWRVQPILEPEARGARAESGGSAGRCVAEEALDVGMRLLRRSSRSRPCTRSAKWFWAWEPPWLDRQADIAVGGSPSALAIGEDCCLFTQDFLVVGPAEGRARLDLCRSTRRTGHLQPRRASYTTSQDAALLMPSFTYAGARSG